MSCKWRYNGLVHRNVKLEEVTRSCGVISLDEHHNTSTTKFISYMEHLEVRIGVLIISLNLLFGVLISAYSWINVLMNSCVIVTLFSLLLYLRRVNIHNTIKLSYRLLFIFVYLLCFAKHFT